MKIWTVLVGVELQPDQHPKTPVIHKVGGSGSGSDTGRGLYALADIRDGGHNAILRELHFVHDVRDSSEDFERSLDNGVGLNPECLIEIRWKVPSETTMPLVHTKRKRPQ